MLTLTMIDVLFALLLIDDSLDPVGVRAASDTRRTGSSALAR